MNRRIVIIQGHPDPAGNHFGHALADAYQKGAEIAGHDVKIIDVARLDFPIIRTREDWEKGEPPECIKVSQDVIAWANHLVLFYPLWLGTMPALLKGFLEQVLRPGFAIDKSKQGKAWNKKLGNRSARIVVTMGMPAFIYRWFFRAHSLRSLERNILKFCGISPVRESIIGLVEGNNNHRSRWLEKMQSLGRDSR
ncbi:MAG TPA: NAD(P)H-dependent oxidoreductase [Gammaproteobacteria bacterium]|nr:NAD(P)H-dependent oxidoreductase [Gammaproteobacteria bacterium]